LWDKMHLFCSQENKYNGKNTTKTSLESDLEKAYLLRVQGNAAPQSLRLLD